MTVFPVYDGKLWFIITRWPIAKFSIFIRAHYQCGNYFSKNVWFLTANSKVLHNIIKVRMVILPLGLTISPHGICSHHKYHQCYIFFIIQPRHQASWTATWSAAEPFPVLVPNQSWQLFRSWYKCVRVAQPNIYNLHYVMMPPSFVPPFILTGV